MGGRGNGRERSREDKMILEEMWRWLRTCPQLGGLIPEDMPAYGGWSLSVTEEEKRDILGGCRLLVTASLTRRVSPSDGEERLERLREMEELGDRLRANVPEGYRLRTIASPQRSARDSAGTEDWTMKLILESYRCGTERQG